MAYEKKRMLVWCQTYPVLSTRYTETVCTGAVELDKPGLLRLYPLVLRGLGDGSRHQKWSVIDAQVEQVARDTRPESWRIANDTIELVEHYSSPRDDRRMAPLLRDEHIYEHLEALAAAQRERRTSMGLIKAEFVRAELAHKPANERREWQEKLEQIRARQANDTLNLFEPVEMLEPVPLPAVVPFLHFRTSDGKTYKRQLMGWEAHMLAVHVMERLRPGQDASEVFSEQLRQKCFAAEHDTYLAMGNLQRFPETFSIISLLYPSKVRQRSLF